MTPLMATVARRHHPLDGQVLAVVGRMCRHGRDELLLVLADGSKSLVPAAWTDQGGSPAGADRPGAEALGAVGDLLAASALAAELSTRAAGTLEQAARRPPSKEDDRATCPAQSAGGRGPVGPTTPIGPVPRGRAGNSARVAGRLDRQGVRGGEPK